MMKVCCGNCGYGLLISDKNKVTFSMRYKDLYFWFTGGLLKMICKGCGTPNLVVDDQYELANKEDVDARKKEPGVVLAVLKEWVGRDQYVPNYAKGNSKPGRH